MEERHSECQDTGQVKAGAMKNESINSIVIIPKPEAIAKLCVSFGCVNPNLSLQANKTCRYQPLPCVSQRADSAVC
jgi:hypothetical protein